MNIRSTAAWSLVLSLAGCALTGPVCDRPCLSAKIEGRMGQPLNEAPPPAQVVLPPELPPDRPLNEDAAVLVALWNNAAFQDLLVDLDLTRADLVQADLLPNPEFAYLFNVPDKPYRYLVDFPIESLWLRPIRIAAASRENARACERLTQGGLDLIRDVRQAYADVLLARDRVKVAEQSLEVRTDVHKLADARLQAGDASPQEAATARIDMLQAQQDLVRIGYEVPFAGERLRNLLGLGDYRPPLTLDETPAPELSDLDIDALRAEALRSRPDALAADWAVASALERFRLQKIGWVRFLGILDATSGNATGHEFGPGARITLPLFNCNQGGIARGAAEVERARRQQVTVHNQIILDVQQAHIRYNQTLAELGILRSKVRPEVEAAIRRAEKAYREGNATYLLVLESTRQLIDTYAREAQLKADLRRAWAELERSVGRRLTHAAPRSEEP